MSRKVVLIICAIVCGIAAFAIVARLRTPSTMEQRKRNLAAYLGMDYQTFQEARDVFNTIQTRPEGTMSAQEEQKMYEYMALNNHYLTSRAIGRCQTHLPDDRISRAVPHVKNAVEATNDEYIVECGYIFLWNRAPREKGWVLADARNRFPDYAKEIENWPPVLTKTNHPSSR